MNEQTTWVLTLNRYQRDNLLHLLRVTLSGGRMQELHGIHCDSGDWHGELRFQLEGDPPPHPNTFYWDHDT